MRTLLSTVVAPGAGLSRSGEKATSYAQFVQYLREKAEGVETICQLWELLWEPHSFVCRCFNWKQKQNTTNNSKNFFHNNLIFN